jgi:lipopolysaccharide/colanic/teichoic acid biosynthesis glycosyltransferase/energy-coupling factor transporter ATP-binding protein EcfA2
MARILGYLGALASFAVGLLTYSHTTSLWKSCLASAGCALLAFGKDVWKELRPLWVKRTADWTDAQLIGWTGSYGKKYAQILRYRHRTFDVRGLTTQGKFSLELENVFVDLTLDSATADAISQEPLRPNADAERDKCGSAVDWLSHSAARGINYAIVGPPGSGKTTLLKHLAVVYADRKGPERLTPVLLFLREHASAIHANPSVTLSELIRQTLKEHAPPARWFERRLDNGKCLVMFDGLDEVANPATRRSVVNWLEDQVQIYGANTFLVASRPIGYRENQVSGFTVLRVLQFDSLQVNEFVKKWYLANKLASYQKDDRGVRDEAAHGSQDLLSRIENSAALHDLAVNPLLLTMIATVHLYRSNLPKRRVELYAEICEVFLGKRREARGIEEDLTPAQEVRVLRVLAYEMMCRRIREIAEVQACEIVSRPLALVKPESNPLEFLKLVESSSGLLGEREQGIFGFAHLTFQEYLASVHMKAEPLSADFVSRVSDAWWHETLRLYAAQTDASAVISTCMEESSRDARALLLAAECDADAFGIRSDVREHLWSLTEQAIESVEAERQAVGAELLLTARLRDISGLLSERHIPASPITNAEYRLFAVEVESRFHSRMPAAWPNGGYPAGGGRKPVSGIRRSDAFGFCKWLTERESNQWGYSLPLSSEVSARAAGDAAASRMFHCSDAPDQPFRSWMILQTIREEIAGKKWPRSIESARMCAAFVLWIVLERIDTEDRRLKLHRRHMDELPLLIDITTGEERELDLLLFGRPEGVAPHSRDLATRVLADDELSRSYMSLMDRRLKISHQQDYFGEDGYSQLISIRDQLSIESELGPSSSLETLAFFRSVKRSAVQAGILTDADLDILCGRLTMLLEAFFVMVRQETPKELTRKLLFVRTRRARPRERVEFGPAPVLVRLSGRPTPAAPEANQEEPLPVSNSGQSGFAFVAKRVFDVAFSLFLFVVLLPLFIVIAILIKLDSRGALLYGSKRVGRKARIFTNYKFRTMVVDADRLRADVLHRNERDGVLFKITNDPRITRVGRVLRKYSLDELPQLINVLRGEMTFVGPRPPLAQEVARYSLDHLWKLDVMPGLTGLWQVQARSDPSFDSYISLDLAYTRNWSFWLDFKIIWRTLALFISGKGT